MTSRTEMPVSVVLGGYANILNAGTSYMLFQLSARVHLY